MKIKRLKSENRRYYSIDDKILSHNAINEICQKYLSNEGLIAMWRRVIDVGECVLDLDINFDCDEKNLLEIKNAELQAEREKNAALEKKLMQLRIKAAKYDCLVSKLKT